MIIIIIDIIILLLLLYQVLSALPSPITGGTMLTVEDLQQELSCTINVKHRSFSFKVVALLF